MTSKGGISDSSLSDAVSENKPPLLVTLQDHERDVSNFYRWAVPPNKRDYAQEAAVVQGPQGPGSPGWAIVNMDRCRDLIPDEHLVHAERGLGDCVGTELKTALAECYGNDVAEPQTEVTLLETSEDAPKFEEWTVLADHFPSVRWLYVETGFCEDWEDSLFPQQWPLEALVVSSSCGQTVTTSVILDGRVPHLVLFLTSGMRFEGPTAEEFRKKPPVGVEPFSVEIGDGKTAKSEHNKSSSEVIECGDDDKGQTETKEVMKNREIEVHCVPNYAAAWMREAHPDGQTFPDEARHAGKPPSRMHTLEILENDAADTFIAMSMACAHVVHHLRRINLRSTSGLDFGRFTCDTLPQLLQQLTNLRELQLSVSDVTFRGQFSDHSESHDNNVLHTIYRYFPPNLEVLEFRGPPSLATSEVFQDWITAFGNTEGGFLPRLKRLSFVLDATFSKNRTDDGKRQPPSENDIAAAVAPTRALLDAARKRGIIVEEFHDPWGQGPHML